MRHFLTSFLLLAGLAFSQHSAAQGSLAALDAKNGFRDAKLGMPVSKFKGLVMVSHSEDISTYSRASDKKSIGDISLNKITYTFYKGRLWQIEIFFNESHMDEIIKTFSVAYGPTSKVEYPLKGKWDTRKIKLHVIGKYVVLGDNPGTAGPYISFESVELANKVADEGLESMVNKHNSNLSKRQSDL